MVEIFSQTTNNVCKYIVSKHEQDMQYDQFNKLGITF